VTSLAVFNPDLVPRESFAARVAQAYELSASAGQVYEYLWGLDQDDRGAVLVRPSAASYALGLAQGSAFTDAQVRHALRGPLSDLGLVKITLPSKKGAAWRVFLCRVENPPQGRFGFAGELHDPRGAELRLREAVPTQRSLYEDDDDDEELLFDNVRDDLRDDSPAVVEGPVLGLSVVESPVEVAPEVVVEDPVEEAGDALGARLAQGWRKVGAADDEASRKAKLLHEIERLRQAAEAAPQDPVRILPGSLDQDPGLEARPGSGRAETRAASPSKGSGRKFELRGAEILFAGLTKASAPERVARIVDRVRRWTLKHKLAQVPGLQGWLPLLVSGLVELGKLSEAAAERCLGSLEDARVRWGRGNRQAEPGSAYTAQLRAEFAAAGLDWARDRQFFKSVCASWGIDWSPRWRDPRKAFCGPRS